MSSDEKKTSVNRVPLQFKIIILVQAAVILAFTVGMYQEYLNNFYLQSYVVSIFTSNLVADVMLSMVTVSVFAIGTFTLLGSMSSNRRMDKEWKLMSEPVEEEMEMPAMPVLENASQDPSGKRPTRRSRPRKPRVTAEDLFRSMTQYADDHKE